MQYLSFVTGLFQENNVLLFYHGVTCDRNSFLFKAVQYFIVCIYDILFIKLPVNGYSVCFYLFAIVIIYYNMIVQISFQKNVFNSFGYMYRSVIARTYNNSIFNFFRNCHTFFHCGCNFFTISPAVYKCTNFSTSLPILGIFSYAH